MLSTSYRLHILAALLASTLVNQAAHAGEVTGLTTFSDGTAAKAAEVNGNFTVIKNAVNEVVFNRGGNFIPNPGFENGLTGWSAVAPPSTGALVRVGDVNGPFGQYAIENPPGTVVWGSSEQWIALDQTSTKSFYVAGVA